MPSAAAWYCSINSGFARFASALVRKPSTSFSGGRICAGSEVSPNRSAIALPYCSRVSNLAGALPGIVASQSKGVETSVGFFAGGSTAQPDATVPAAHRHT